MASPLWATTAPRKPTRSGGVSAVDGQAECLDEVTFVFAPEVIRLSRDAGPDPQTD